MQCSVCLQDRHLDDMEAFLCAHVCCKHCFRRCDKCPECRRAKHDTYDPRDPRDPRQMVAQRHTRSLSEPSHASPPMVAIALPPVELLSALALSIIESGLPRRR